MTNSEAILTEDSIYCIMKELLPSQNDFGKCDYNEELEELNYFEINTNSKFRSLIKTHLDRLLQIDQEALDDQHIEWYKDEFGIDYVNERVKNKFWFAFPALIRLALELEFDTQYKEFADKRDGLIN